MVTLREHVQTAEARLSEGPHPERARLDAEALLRFVLQRDRAWMMTHARDPLPTEQAVHFDQLVARRSAGEPLQYILGETEFYGLPFRVTRDVLIPRPETEHLVEKVLALAKEMPAPRIVDVGTGSGAIAVALAHALPHAQVTAIDLSAEALRIARANAERNAATIRFLQGDLLQPVAAERFDFVVSNPPYVPEEDRPTLAVEVRDYEPELALFASGDGMDVYRALIPAAWSVLNPGGFVALEIGHGQSKLIGDLLQASGFETIEFVPDLQGIPRVACACRK